jgi:hypothetical protein
MAKPRVFVSSTYYDLKHVRASVEVFIESLGFDPILAEYGSIAFDPSQPLDESCYREAQASDIFVLIIGGRYGSIVSSLNSSAKQREEELESITRREFTRAHDADIPVYVLIEGPVHAEYQTFMRNKDNDTIKYASVDSPRIFRFIEFVYSKQRNNPVHPFERGLDIELWLREQWAGMFQEMLRQRKANSSFSDLAAQIRQLEAVNTTLKSYMESVLQSISPAISDQIIEKENKSLDRSRMIESARKNAWFNHVVRFSTLSADQVLELHLSIATVNDIVPQFKAYLGAGEEFAEVLDPIEDFDDARRDFNRLRAIFGQRTVRFTAKFLSDISKEIYEARINPTSSVKVFSSSVEDEEQEEGDDVV